MSVIKSIAKRTAAADTGTYVKAHDVYGSVREHCHQNNIFEPADTTRTQSFYTFIAGKPNGPFNEQIAAPPTPCRPATSTAPRISG